MGRAASSSVTTFAMSRARLWCVRLKLPRRTGMSRIASPRRFIDASRLSMIRSTVLVAEVPVGMSAPPVLLDQVGLEPLGLGDDDPQRGLAAAQRGADLVGPGDVPVPLVAGAPVAGLGGLDGLLGLAQGVAHLLQGLPELPEPGYRPPVRASSRRRSGLRDPLPHSHRSHPPPDR